MPVLLVKGKSITPMRCLWFPDTVQKRVLWGNGYSSFIKTAMILWKVMSSTPWMDNIEMVHEKAN